MNAFVVTIFYVYLECENNFKKHTIGTIYLNKGNLERYFIKKKEIYVPFLLNFVSWQFRF